MMGRVSEHVIALVRRQVHERGIVVWYDPEGHYGRLVEDLHLDNVTILRCGDSLWELREKIEPFLDLTAPDGHVNRDALVPPPLLIYVPRARTDTHHALLEAEEAGAIVEPGASGRSRNTRLRVMAEQVFRAIAPDRSDAIAKQVEDGGLGLEDLDVIAEQTREIGTGTVKLIFGTGSAAAAALTFAASSDFDTAIEMKKASPELALLLKQDLGLAIDPGASCSEARTSLRRMLLVTDFIARLPAGKTPRALASIPLPGRTDQRLAIARLCEDWRHRTDLRSAYVDAATGVEHDVGLAGLELDPERIYDVETFPGIEERLLRHAEDLILRDEPQRAGDLAARRLRAFWSSEDPAKQLRWTILETAARLLVACGLMKDALKGAPKDLAAIVRGIQREIPLGALSTPTSVIWSGNTLRSTSAPPANTMRSNR